MPSPPATAASVPPSIAPGNPSPSPAPTQNPNLLSLERGTFVRHWTVGASRFGAQSLVTNGAWATDGPAAGTPELVFEFPGVAQISQITAVAELPNGSSARLEIAASKTGADRDFADVGSIALAAQSGQSTGALSTPLTARWLRLRVARTPADAKVRIESLVATGTLTVPPPATFAGRWAVADDVAGIDTVFAPAKGSIPATGTPTGTYEIATAEHDGTLIAATCNYYRDVWRGPISGGTATIDGGGSLNIVAGGSLLAGSVGGEKVLARRITTARACDVTPAGRGSPIAIVTRYLGNLAQAGDPLVISGHRYATHLLPLLTAEDLRGTNLVVLAMSCAADKDAAPWQQRMLLDFVARGRVLVIRDADTCSKSAYAFVPYPFATFNAGAGGARGSVLSIADSSALASADASDKAQFVDTVAYLKSPSQQIGDADVIKTDDPHWCGLMFAKNVKGDSGWVRAYARYGKGLIVYDGFDIDDLRGRIPQAITLNRLAYGISPNADLPCNAQVASALVLLSSQHRTVAFGTARDFRFSLMLDQEGTTTPERVALSLTGERAPGWRAAVDRRDVTLASSPQHLIVIVHVPANAAAGKHLYTLSAAGERGQRAQAAIEFDVNEALAKELRQKGGRARIYGIHFDVASARIQPQSQATIREIAAVLRDNPAWNMRIEGYTDSDGGAAYNLALSRRRAQAVVNDLVSHYGIARRRLTAYGYGLSHPVASNATDAGKALNRRVELARR